MRVEINLIVVMIQRENQKMNSLYRIMELDILKYNWKLPLPSPEDESYFRVLSEISKLPAEQLGNDFREALQEQHDRLNHFSERMASLGVREKNVERIRIGLFALVLSSVGEWGDFRETLMVVPLHLRSLEILGFKADDIIAQVPTVIVTQGPVKGQNRATLLEDFMRRPPEERTIQTMGFKETGTTTGLVYEQTWLKSKPV